MILQAKAQVQNNSQLNNAFSIAHAPNGISYQEVADGEQQKTNVGYHRIPFNARPF